MRELVTEDDAEEIVIKEAEFLKDFSPSDSVIISKTPILLVN